MLSDTVCDFTVYCPEMAEKTRAGQFLHILCGGSAYLRRPISVCEVKNGESVRFIFQIRGEGTKALAAAECGDMLDILGPLGNGFDLGGADGTILLVGGGIGIFPLLGLAKALDGKASAAFGFRTERDVLLTDEFAACTKNIFVATDDGSCGYKGLVTDVVRNITASNTISRMYICGPEPMMRAVSAIADEFGIDAQVSLEQRMGCGVGACVGCTCTVNGAKRRVCKDGPVFSASEVEWDG